MWVAVSEGIVFVHEGVCVAVSEGIVLVQEGVCVAVRVLCWCTSVCVVVSEGLGGN